MYLNCCSLRLLDGSWQNNLDSWWWNYRVVLGYGTGWWFIIIQQRKGKRMWRNLSVHGNRKSLIGKWSWNHSGISNCSENSNLRDLWLWTNFTRPFYCTVYCIICVTDIYAQVTINVHMYVDMNKRPGLLSWISYMNYSKWITHHSCSFGSISSLFPVTSLINTECSADIYWLGCISRVLQMMSVRVLLMVTPLCYWK